MLLLFPSCLPSQEHFDVTDWLCFLVDNEDGDTHAGFKLLVIVKGFETCAGIGKRKPQVWAWVQSL